MYAGEVDEGASALAALKAAVGTPAVDLLDRMPYTAFQSLVDPFSPTGLLNYHRGEHLRALPDEAIDAYLAHGAQVGSPMSQALIFRHGGAIARVPEEATAAGHRSAPYMWHPIAAWADPADTEREMAWVRAGSAAMKPFETGGVYLNFEQDEGEQHVRAGYGDDKFDRLVALKDRYDPYNLFRINQNIPPSVTVQQREGQGPLGSGNGEGGDVRTGNGREGS
jgi:hypothetical protein